MKLLAALAVLCALLTAPVAVASPQRDGLFLYFLGEAGFEYESASDVISVGHGVCRALTAGASAEEIATAIGKRTGMSYKASRLFSEIASSILCGDDADDPHRTHGRAPQRL